MSNQVRGGKRGTIRNMRALVARWRANDVNARDREVNTLFSHVVDAETVELTAPLLSYKADIDVKHRKGTTGLHLAVARRDGEMLKCLLEKGATADVQDDRGDTPSHCAAHTGQLKLLLLLFNNGADWSVKNNQGYDVLTAAEMTQWRDVQKRSEYLLSVRSLMSRQRKDKQLTEAYMTVGRPPWMTAPEERRLPTPDRDEASFPARLAVNCKNGSNWENGNDFEFSDGLEVSLLMVPPE